jgi:hypothetical protein
MMTICCILQMTQQHQRPPGDSVGAGQPAAVGHLQQVRHCAASSCAARLWHSNWQSLSALYPLAITIRSRMKLNCAEASWLPLASCVIVHGRVPAGTSRPGTAQLAALPTLQEQQQQQDIVFLDTGALQLQTIGSHAQTSHHQQQRCSDAGLQQLSASGSGALICSNSCPPCSSSTVQPGQHSSLHSIVEVWTQSTHYASFMARHAPGTFNYRALFNKTSCSAQ